MNSTTVSGNLTGPARLSMLDNGNLVLNFQIASDSIKESNGQIKKHTNFFSISVFGEKCRWLSENLNVGSRVAIIGELVFSSWKKDNEPRNKVEIIAKNVVICSP